MNIDLSWNLFALAFLGVIVAYSLIIGRNQTIKIILSTYIAILTTEASSNLLSGFAPKFLTLLFPGMDLLSAEVIIKISLFVGLIIFLTLRGNFQVGMDEEGSFVVTMAFNAVFGFLSGVLLVSTLLVYIDGGSFLPTLASHGATGILASIKRVSPLIQSLVTYYDLCVAAPALFFAGMSFWKK